VDSFSTLPCRVRVSAFWLYCAFNANTADGDTYHCFLYSPLLHAFLRFNYTLATTVSDTTRCLLRVVTLPTALPFMARRCAGWTRYRHTAAHTCRFPWRFVASRYPHHTTPVRQFAPHRTGSAGCAGYVFYVHVFTAPCAAYAGSPGFLLPLRMRRERSTLRVWFCFLSRFRWFTLATCYRCGLSLCVTVFCVLFAACGTRAHRRRCLTFQRDGLVLSSFCRVFFGRYSVCDQYRAFGTPRIIYLILYLFPFNHTVRHIILTDLILPLLFLPLYSSLRRLF